MNRRAVALATGGGLLLTTGIITLQLWNGPGKPGSGSKGLTSSTGAGGLEQFDQGAVDELAHEVVAQQGQADQAYASWLSTHHRAHRDDFERFALAQIPAPPGADRQRAELAELARLASSRTPGLVAAATEYERTGKVDIWDGFGGGLPHSLRKRLGDDLKQAQSLADRLSGDAKQHFDRPSPYVLEPSLRPDKSPDASRTKVSYPSTHAIYAYAQGDILSAIDPAHASTYQETAGQVVYSRMYMAGHYRSDVLAGALLGHLIADYVLGDHSSG